MVTEHFWKKVEKHGTFFLGHPVILQYVIPVNTIIQYDNTVNIIIQYDNPMFIILRYVNSVNTIIQYDNPIFVIVFTATVKMRFKSISGAVWFELY